MKSPERSSVSADIVLAQQGNQIAFRNIVRNTYEYAYRLAARMVEDHDEAEDICQEAYIRVWRHLGSFDTTMQFTTWLYRIVANLCLDRIKARKRSFERFFRFGDSDHSPSISDLPRTLDTIESRDVVAVVRSLISTLPPTQRLVFVLRDFEDLEVDEVVEITGLSRGSVKTNLSYARASIRTALVEHFGEEGVSR